MDNNCSCDCYYFCGADLLSCDIGDLWNLKCSSELVMGCSLQTDGSGGGGTPVSPPVARPVARPAAPPVKPPVAPPVKRPVAPPVKRPVAPPVKPPVAPPVKPPVKPPVAPPVKPPVKAPTGSVGTSGIKSCSRTSNASAGCPNLMKTAVGQ